MPYFLIFLFFVLTIHQISYGQITHDLKETPIVDMSAASDVKAEYVPIADIPISSVDFQLKTVLYNELSSTEKSASTDISSQIKTLEAKIEALNVQLKSLKKLRKMSDKEGKKSLRNEKDTSKNDAKLKATTMTKTCDFSGLPTMMNLPSLTVECDDSKQVCNPEPGYCGVDCASQIWEKNYQQVEPKDRCIGCLKCQRPGTARCFGTYESGQLLPSDGSSPGNNCCSGSRTAENGAFSSIPKCVEIRKNDYYIESNTLV